MFQNCYTASTSLMDSVERCIGRAASAARVAASFASRCARTAANSPRRSTGGSLEGSTSAAASATHSPINAWYRSPRAPMPLTNHTFGRLVCARPASGIEPSGLRGGIARTPARAHTGAPAAARGGKSATSPGWSASVAWARSAGDRCSASVQGS